MTTVRDIYISITINHGKEKRIMVQPVEARGHRSICTLLDLQDWDAAKRRLRELGVDIRHHRNKPVVNIEEVKAASKKWFKKS